MNDEYIIEHLKQLMQLMAPNKTVFARKYEEDMFAFGTRAPLIRNIVSRQVAIYLICNKLK